MLTGLLVLFACVDHTRFVAAIDINETNIAKPIEVQFVPLEGEHDISIALRYDPKNIFDILPVEAVVRFEDSTFYYEKIDLQLKKDGQYLGKKKGGVIDVEIVWRKNVTFKKEGLVTILIKPSMAMVDWEGVHYVAVKVTNATLIPVVSEENVDI